MAQRGARLDDLSRVHQVGANTLIVGDFLYLDVLAPISFDRTSKRCFNQVRMLSENFQASSQTQNLPKLSLKSF